MNTKTIWLALVAALVLLVAVIASCGDDDSSSTSASDNKTDAAFIADMSAHHEGAIDMAELAQEKAAHAQIRSLADDIISAQKAEIAAMKTIGDDMHSMGMHDHGDMGMSQHEMGMDMDIGALESAKPFDKAFIDAMVPHHQGAIAMAEAELAKGNQPALRDMAEKIIGAQKKEIDQMKEWRETWYGSANVPMDMDDDGSSGDMHSGG
jgi:uncharacterized protein (DUF305 family)